MSDTRPRPDSRRTWSRSADLAAGRGCVPENDCWSDCLMAAHGQIVDGSLAADDRQLMRAERARQYPNHREDS